MPRHIRTPFDETLPHPVYFRTDSLQPDSSYPRHRHHWGEFVHAFSGVMELKLAGRHYLAPPQYGELEAAPRQGTYLPTSDDPLLRPILGALEARPDDPRTLAAWARVVHATERTLVRRCQRDLGMSFGEWRQRLRVVRALALLEAGRSVESIALDLGYGSSSAFIAMFRRMTGASPDKLRREAALAGARSSIRRRRRGAVTSPA